MAILTGIRGRGRLGALQRHRLQVFLECFSDYCDGKTTIEHVQHRWKLLRDSGWKL